MKFTQMYVGNDGESHFRDAEFDEQADGTGATLLLQASASTVRLDRLPPEYQQDWFAESSILAVVVSGEVVVTMTDGERRHFGAGDMLRVDDINSRGHLLRGGNSETLLLLVKLADPELPTALPGNHH